MLVELKWARGENIYLFTLPTSEVKVTITAAPIPTIPTITPRLAVSGVASPFKQSMKQTAQKMYTELSIEGDFERAKGCGVPAS